MKKINIMLLTIISIATISVLICNIILTKELINTKNKLNDKENIIKELANENIKLKYENESLWDNYYMNATNYEGYEYYE